MKKGFTLVELSIVLVIIGLLTGGVLAGRSLIISANLHQLTKTLQQYEATASAFKSVYGTIPGDSDSLTPNAPGYSNNGVINSWTHMFQTMTDANWLEFSYFWLQLNQADMLNEKFTAYSGGNNFNGNFKGLVPALKYGKNCYLNAMTIVSEGSGDATFGNSWVISGGMSEGIGQCMTATEGQRLDKKLDDGLPMFGAVRIMYPYSGPRVNGHMGCAIPSGESYDLAGAWGIPKGSPACLMAIQAKW